MAVNCPKCVSRTETIDYQITQQEMVEKEDKYICPSCGCIVYKTKKRT